jgi:hypothetical protein
LIVSDEEAFFSACEAILRIRIILQIFRDEREAGESINVTRTNPLVSYAHPETPILKKSGPLKFQSAIHEAAIITRHVREHLECARI